MRLLTLLQCNCYLEVLGTEVWLLVKHIDLHLQCKSIHLPLATITWQEVLVVTTNDVRKPDACVSVVTGCHGNKKHVVLQSQVAMASSSCPVRVLSYSQTTNHVLLQTQVAMAAVLGEYLAMYYT